MNSSHAPHARLQQIGPTAFGRRAWSFAFARGLGITVLAIAMVMAGQPSLAQAATDGSAPEATAPVATTSAVAPPGAAPTGAAQSAPRASRDLAFTVGVLSGVTNRSLTLSFEDGATETYLVDDSTQLQTQNGDVADLADFEVGQLVLIVTADGDPTALTVVTDEGDGFQAAGPADIRGHEHDECGPCATEASGGVPARGR